MDAFFLSLFPETFSGGNIKLTNKKKKKFRIDDYNQTNIVH